MSLFICFVYCDTNKGMFVMSSLFVFTIRSNVFFRKHDKPYGILSFDWAVFLVSAAPGGLLPHIDRPQLLALAMASAAAAASGGFVAELLREVSGRMRRGGVVYSCAVFVEHGVRYGALTFVLLVFCSSKSKRR